MIESKLKSYRQTDIPGITYEIKQEKYTARSTDINGKLLWESFKTMEEAINQKIVWETEKKLGKATKEWMKETMIELEQKK